MVLKKEEVVAYLGHEPYAVVVTNGKNGMTSRTMTFGYVPDNKMFLLTHNGTAKLEDIDYSSVGLVHISTIKEDVTQSVDVSAEGTFERIEVKSPLFAKGMEALGSKNPQIIDILSDESMRSQYSMILIKIRRMSAWSYIQVLSGEPKTMII
jgi:hypothetical protein